MYSRASLRLLPLKALSTLSYVFMAPLFFFASRDDQRKVKNQWSCALGSVDPEIFSRWPAGAPVDDPPAKAPKRPTVGDEWPLSSHLHDELSSSSPDERMLLLCFEQRCDGILITPLIFPQHFLAKMPSGLVHIKHPRTHLYIHECTYGCTYSIYGSAKSINSES